MVGIGILLALQVNNWNELKKNKEKEYDILTSLQSEMNVNLKELKDDFQAHQFFYQATLNVYDYIQKKPPLVDSMYRDFYQMVGFNYFFPKTSTFQTLRTGNLDLIRSDKLKEHITQVYDSGFGRITKKVETRRNAARLLFPYYQKHFRTKLLKEEGEVLTMPQETNNYLMLQTKLGIPNDYVQLIHDPEFETLVVEAISGRHNLFYGYQVTIESVEECLMHMNEYLNNL